MPASSSGERLLALADHLDSDLAHQLRRLAAADSEAHRYLEVVARAEFAEDLVKELRRHVASLERQLERKQGTRGRVAAWLVIHLNHEPFGSDTIPGGV